jgi:hypothetical protein
VRAAVVCSLYTIRTVRQQGLLARCGLQRRLAAKSLYKFSSFGIEWSNISDCK